VPVYRRLYDYYRHAIVTQQFPPGSRIDSINELQERHKVSRETAKRVLAMLAADKLIIQQAGRGSFVSHLGPRKPVWGVIVPFFSSQIESLVAHLAEEAEAAKQAIELCVGHNNWEEEIRLVGKMINERYEAVIVIPTLDETKTAEFYRRLASGGTVVTLLDHTMAGSYFTYVIQSYDLGVKRAVEYLLQGTRLSLAFVGRHPSVGRNMIQELMEESFRGFVESAGRTAFIINRVADVSQPFLTRNRIGGFFCCDDIDAIRVAGRLKESGINLGSDVKLVSYGNTDLAIYFTPPITSIDGHLDIMAARTAAIIKQHLKGQHAGTLQFVIQPDLVVRDT